MSAATLMHGTYELTGSNSEFGDVNYRGEVTIQPNGTNFDLTWKVGRYLQQSQLGTGILNGDILSVVYYDQGSRTFGVVSYELTSTGQLQGKWAPFGSSSGGLETLVWKGY